MDIHILTGHLGSGKTEVAVNLAFHLKRQLQHAHSSLAIALIDIDVVNPYFAAREVRAFLEARGIHVAAPAAKTITAEVPVLPADVYQCLHRSDQVVILDVGGDPAGARILGSLAIHLQSHTLFIYCVVNTKRPSTSTSAGILAHIDAINAASRFRITGLIHNTHLLHETSLEDIRQGRTLLEQVSQETGLPIMFTTAMRSLAQQLQQSGNDVLAMDQYIKPPYIV
jgi:hypothetical protein